MCGFVAVIGQCNAGVLREMGKLIEHRGPDEQSEWTDGVVSVVFRRLSVVNPAGSHQPLRSEDGTILVWFNGEIYNHRVLRDMLQQAGHLLIEEGDGEVIAHLYEEYGERFLHYLEGMFAIVIYDQRLQRCLVGRDRYGIKPLFYRQDALRTVFSSAPAPLLTVGATPGLNRAALGPYLRYRYVPSDEHQLIQGVRKVPAGSLCVVDIQTDWQTGPQTDSQRHPKTDRQPQPHPHRQPEETETTLAAHRVTPRTPSTPSTPSTLTIATHVYYVDKGHLEASSWHLPSRKIWQDSLLRVRQSLTAAVERHLMADVPVGVFLSGGVDSALMVGLMRQTVGPNAPIHTFTASFLEGESEGERARGREGASGERLSPHSPPRTPD